MIERGKDFGFPLESSNTVSVLCKFLWQDFDCDITPELLIGSLGPPYCKSAEEKGR
jgi:hypothetical protein